MGRCSCWNCPISIFSEEFILIILLLAYLGTWVFGFAMILSGAISDICPNLNGDDFNPRYFSTGACTMTAYFLRYIMPSFCKINQIAAIFTDTKFIVMWEFTFGLFWLIWGIRGIILYAIELTAACQKTDTGECVLAYGILLIIVGLSWMYQGISARKELTKANNDLDEDLLNEKDNYNL